MQQEQSGWREASHALDSGFPTRAQAALVSLSHRRTSLVDAALRDSLCSELALVGGDNDRADYFASRLESAALPEEALARAAAVRAIVSSDAGRHDEAAHFARSSSQHASRTANGALQARIACRLLPLHLDSSSLPEAQRAVESTYEVVRNGGDPTVAAHLHVIHATLEGRKGLTDRAWWHLDVAREMLTYARHPLVGTLCSLTSMVVASLEDDHESTVRHGREALDTAERVGYRRLVPRIQSNLGLGLLRLGRLEDAAGLFAAASLQPLPKTSRVGLSDSLAQLHLLKEDYSGSADYLQQALTALGTDHALHGWYRLSLLETSLEHDLAIGGIDCVSTALHAQNVAQTMGNRHFEHVFALLAARAYCAIGQHREALSLATSTAPFAAGETSFTTVGRREVVLAQVYRETRHWSRALLHLERATRVLTTVGTSLQQKQAQQVTRSFDVVVPNRDRGNTSIGLSFDSAGFLIECADHPEVLAKEVTAQLQTIQPVASALLVYESAPPGIAPLVLAGNGALSRQPNLNVYVGSTGRARCSLRVWTADSALQNQSRVIARIAEAAAIQRDMRRQTNATLPDMPLAAPSVTAEGVFDAPSVRIALDRLERVASTPLSVLFVGETGTGKEVMARLLHHRSARAQGPFIPFNCANTPHDMFDAQLFGHSKGAFTGAVTDSIGLVRAADRGTLFLDEVGELPLLAQPKLLRFLEYGEVHPIGAPRPITVDVRIVTATNGNLRQMVEDGAFREDLYFRLDGITIRVPPLRHRREDIPTLARLFLGRFAASMGRSTPVLSPGAVELLLIQPWPGNVRQLSNEMRRLVALLPPGAAVTAQALAEVLSPSGSGDESANPAHHRATDPAGDDGEDGSLEAAVDRLERRMILTALEQAGGRVADAASRLGLSRKGLFLKRRRLGID